MLRESIFNGNIGYFYKVRTMMKTYKKNLGSKIPIVLNPLENNFYYHLNSKYHKISIIIKIKVIALKYFYIFYVI